MMLGTSHKVPGSEGTQDLAQSRCPLPHGSQAGRTVIPASTEVQELFVHAAGSTWVPSTARNKA